MSHFAKVEQGIVTQVIVAEQDFIDTVLVGDPCKWIQTSYNTRHNIHYDSSGNPDGGIALRGNFAGIDYVYDKENDVFYPPKPHNSWTLNKEIWDWMPPVEYPKDGSFYKWNELIQEWVADN